MERAVAVLVGGVGVLLLTLMAVAWSGSDGGRDGGGVDLLALPGGSPQLAGQLARGHDAASAGTTAQSLATVAGPSSTAPTAVTGAAAATGPAAVAGPSGAVTGAAGTGTAAEAAAATEGAPAERAPGAAVPPGVSTTVPPAVLGLLQQISSGGIRFEVARSELDGEAVALLEQLAAQLAAHPEVVVMVRGHTDSTGTEDFNRELSARRAQVVAEMLVARGARAGQLVTVGVGPAEPVADNATADGRQANRRSEVVVEGRSP